MAAATGIGAITARQSTAVVADAAGGPPTPLPGTALFLHGFKAWDRGGSGTAHVRVRPAHHDRAFGSFPSLHERSYVIEYSTSVPFAEAATAVRTAIDATLATAGVGHDDIIVHAHSMGGLIAARALAGTTPVAFFSYDSPFGGLHWLVAKAIREASGSAAAAIAGAADGSGSGGSSGGSSDSSGSTSWLRILSDPVGLLLAKFGGGLLSRARMEPGQMAFLAPILASGDEGEAIRMSLREELMAMRRRGTAVHLALWDHPLDTEALEHAPAPAAAAAHNGGGLTLTPQSSSGAGGGGASAAANPNVRPAEGGAGSAGGSSPAQAAAVAGRAVARSSSASATGSRIHLGILPPDIESSFLSLLPRHMFAAADGPDGWSACEWRWHAQSSAGTVFDHLAQHGGGRMFDDGTPYKAAVLQKAWEAIHARQQRQQAQAQEQAQEQQRQQERLALSDAQAAAAAGSGGDSAASGQAAPHNATRPLRVDL